ncbi:MAG: hypothetical protein WC722_11490 [Rhodospirillales bacterium]|jgi:hypothetical protein
MLSLTLPSEPQWIDLANGVRILSMPLTTQAELAAEAQARRSLATYCDNQAVLDGVDLDNDALLDALFDTFKLIGLASFLIKGWEGIEGDCNFANIQAFCENQPTYSRMWRSYVRAPRLALEQEKNASGPAQPGDTAAGPDIAKTAATPASPAPAAPNMPAPTTSTLPTASTDSGPGN